MKSKVVVTVILEIKIQGPNIKLNVYGETQFYETIPAKRDSVKFLPANEGNTEKYE